MFASQGRVLYDLMLYRLKADKLTVLIECQHDVTSDLVSNLLRYKLRKKVLCCMFSHGLLLRKLS